jgi:hypothetical protein
MKKNLLVLGMLLATSLSVFAAADHAAKPAKPVSAKKFDALANAALEAMKQRAAELKVTGVAVVSYAQGDTIQGWTSKMAVVGRMKDPQTATEKGNNLLGIAYAKSAEMADTLQNSGTAKRPPMTVRGRRPGLPSRPGGSEGRLVAAGGEFRFVTGHDFSRLKNSIRREAGVSQAGENPLVR